MSYSQRITLLSIACISMTACAVNKQEGATSTLPADLRYLGQPLPGLIPELFAPGIVNTDAIEFNGVVSADGREFYFTRLVGGAGTDAMHQVVYANGEWGEPRELSLFPTDARVESADMVLSKDGRELYFLAKHTNVITGPEPNYDLWVSYRVNGDWSEAKLVGPPISTAANEFYPVLGADGSLYFSSDRAGGLSRSLPGMFASDLYRSTRLPDGTFGKPENLGPPVNSDYGTGDMSLAPDESYMVMSLKRPGNLGRGDLYVSFRHSDGTWGKPVSFGDKINTEHHEWSPMVTPDGNYLFFSRLLGENLETATGGDVYWVDARILDQFRP